MAATTTPVGRIPTESSWSDPRTGVREEAAFLGSPGHRILAFLHRPPNEVVHGGVVLCSSVYEDFHVNYRSELLVARELARRGYPTVRFHYRAMGNSDDLDGGAMTFDTMVADARAAASWLADRTGTARVTVCGSRVGALVAAHLAASDDGTPLILWAPIVNGADFFRGMSRASRLAGVRIEARNRQEPSDAARPLTTDGGVEMLGNVVHAASREDLSARALPAGIGSGRRTLLVQLGMGDADIPHYRELASRWEAGGAVVDVLKVRMRQLWMVPDKWEAEEDLPTTRQLVEGIADWVEATRGESS